MAYKNIEYEYRTIHIAPGKDEQLRPEFSAINPLGQVPAFIMEHGGRKLIMIQSMAIINFLEDIFPDAPKLIPSDPLAKCQMRMIVDTICSGIQPLQNLAILDKMNQVKKGMGAEWAIEVIEKGFNGLEKMLEESCGKFCVGDQFTLADICLVPQVYNARRYNVDVSKYPFIHKLSSALEEHPAIAVSHPSKMPDAVV